MKLKEYGKGSFNLYHHLHLAQVKNYLTAYDIPQGLLINFGSASMQYKLIFNKKYYCQDQNG